MKRTVVFVNSAIMSDSQAAKDHDEQKSKENKYQSRTRSPLKRCWHGDKCKKPNCKFWHPKGRATGAPGRNVRVKRKPKRKPRALNDDNTSEQTASEEDENATHDDEDLISQDAADNDGTCGETTKQIEVKQSCPAGSSCMDFLCPFCDPFRPADCKSGAKCLNIDCPDAHPLGWKVCDKGVTCCDFSCEALHPAGRTEKCPKGDSCWNSSCEFLHPDHWAPREIKTGKI